MRSNLIILAFILLSVDVFAQSKNAISLVYCIAGTRVASTGDFSNTEYQSYPYTISAGTKFGLTYTRDLGQWVSVGAGLMLITDNARYTYVYGTTSALVNKGKLTMVSPEGFGRFKFFKYLFINAGVAIDTQLTDNIYNQYYDQSGIAGEVGFGAQFNTGRLVFSVNPYLRDHIVFTIYKSAYNDRLVEDGIKFSIGYNF
ncbi:MAG: hypothetical protein JSU01_20320 [Bacteroidetes bacterium]|nr:hypothetical protein [Bacteroidota bacterium]